MTIVVVVDITGGSGSGKSAAASSTSQPVAARTITATMKMTVTAAAEMSVTRSSFLRRGAIYSPQPVSVQSAATIRRDMGDPVRSDQAVLSSNAASLSPKGAMKARSFEAQFCKGHLAPGFDDAGTLRDVTAGCLPGG